MRNLALLQAVYIPGLRFDRHCIPPFSRLAERNGSPNDFVARRHKADALAKHKSDGVDFQSDNY
jgi:hypothetical protein